MVDEGAALVLRIRSSDSNWPERHLSHLLLVLLLPFLHGTNDHHFPRALGRACSSLSVLASTIRKGGTRKGAYGQNT